MENTIDDFWRMVLERKVSIIVMLNFTKEPSEVKMLIIFNKRLCTINAFLFLTDFLSANVVSIH